MIIKTMTAICSRILTMTTITIINHHHHQQQRQQQHYILYMILPLPHRKITRSELIMVQARSMLWFTQVSVNTWLAQRNEPTNGGFNQ